MSKAIHAQQHGSDLVFAASDVTLTASNEGSPEVDVTAYTGGLLSLKNFQHPVVVNIDGVRAMHNEQIPFLRDHSQEKVVGHGKPQVGSKELRHQGRLSVAGDERDRIVAASKEGFSWQASIGGRVPDIRKNVQTIAASEKVRVNGRVFDGPLHVVNAFIWKETSFVAVGADEGRASASIAAAQSMGVTPMNEFEKWLEASGVDSEALSESQLDNLKAAFDALKDDEKSGDKQVTAASVSTGIDMDAIVTSATRAAVEAAQQQSQRERRIDRLFANYSDVAMSEEELGKLRASVESGEVSEDKAHLELLLASRGRGGTSNVHVRGNVSSNYALELEAAVSRTAGLTEEQIHQNLVAAGANDDVAEAAVDRTRNKPRGLKSIIHAICRQEGHHVDEVDDDAIRCAMHASAREGVIQASGQFSTVSLSGILSRLANKAMLASYAEADNGGVATRIASITSTRDFKKFSRYRMTESGIMEEVGPAGEINHGSLDEDTYENQLKTYGKILSLTRQMIRNDDMDAFMQVPRLIGRMGRHALEQITIETLVNATVNASAGTTEFFHGAARTNDQPNYAEGAGTALSIDSLGDAYELFLNQTDSDGKPIMIEPGILLVSTANYITARKLYSDTEYRFTDANTTSTINNQWQGMFEPLKSSYLHRLGTSPSSLAWYLLARPSTDIAALQIGFLDGMQTPTINQSETTFDTLGMQMRGYFDFGVALQDPRAIVKMKGEA